jgi:hypothetical protein
MYPYLKYGQNDVKGPHAEGYKFYNTLEATGSKTGPRRVVMGPNRPTLLIPGPVRRTL